MKPFVRKPSPEHLKRYKKDAEQFLKTGDVNPYRMLEYGFQGARDYKDVLIWYLHKELEVRSAGLKEPALPDFLDGKALSEVKFKPMVSALFPKKEQDIVLEAMENSVIFLTKETVKKLIWELTWESTSRTLVNIYLCSIDAEPLDDSERGCLGLSEETCCYVSLSYFQLSEEEKRFEDYVLHEGAHIFHNNKRKRIGLPETRTKEWLLPIDFRKRELFAYACEIYGTISERIQDAKGIKKRRAAVYREVEEYEKHGVTPADDSVDRDELVALLKTAATARTSAAGWKRILKYCSR